MITCLKQAIVTSIEDPMCPCDFGRIEKTLAEFGISSTSLSLTDEERHKVDTFFDSLIISNEKSPANIYIPNLDTISTLFDRLSIECVKLSHLLCQLSVDAITYDSYSSSKNTQINIIDGLI